MAHVGKPGHQLLASVIRRLQKYLIYAWGFSLAASPLLASTDRAVIEENQGKALLIYNIAKFTVWPAEMVASDEPFVFALWDKKTLAQGFQILNGQTIQNRKVSIATFRGDKIPDDCEVLIIPGNELKNFIKARDKLSSLPVLTVTTDPKTFEAGAMVLVEVIDDHLSFSVNLGIIRASELEISGNLLRHAKEVKF